MSRTLSSRVRGLTALSGAAFIAALATGRPELAVLAVPLLLIVGVGLVLATEPRLAAVLKLERDRLLEGEDVRASVNLRNRGDRATELELELVTSPHLVAEPSGPIVLRLQARGRPSSCSTRARPVGGHT